MINKYLKKLESLRAFNLPLGEYAITGSGPLAIRSLREAGDIDIIVKKPLWLSLLQKYTPYDEKHMRIGQVEIWGDFINLTERMDEVIDHAENLLGYPFVTLQDTLLWKEFLNRKKDQIDIEIIKKYLQAQKNDRAFSL